VWATKEREAVIDPQVEDLILRSMQSSCTEMGAPVHAFGIVPDHMHAVVSIPPRISISEFVQEMKGKSSHRVNDAIFRARGETFAWQPEYGVISFGDQSLGRIVSYVANQKQHHSDATLWPFLETIDRRDAPRHVVENTTEITQP
jgi:putative transposase